MSGTDLFICASIRKVSIVHAIKYAGILEQMTNLPCKSAGEGYLLKKNNLWWDQFRINQAQVANATDKNLVAFYGDSTTICKILVVSP
jgi:hypothetical protein